MTIIYHGYTEDDKQIAARLKRMDEADEIAADKREIAQIMGWLGDPTPEQVEHVQRAIAALKADPRTVAWDDEPEPPITDPPPPTVGDLTALGYGDLDLLAADYGADYAERAELDEIARGR